MRSVEFLKYLFENTYGYFELVYLAPSGLDLKPHIKVLSLPSYKFIRWAQVAEMNQRGYGVHYGLTTKREEIAAGKRSKEADAMFLPCLWADIDDVNDKQAEVERLLNHEHQPSVIIDSGGGLQAVWKLASPVLLDENRVRIVKDSLRGLALAHRGDESVAELSRLFRLPDTTNTKPKRNGAQCRVIFEGGPVYKLGDFAQYAIMGAPPLTPVEHNFPVHPQDDMPAFVRAYVDTNHVEGTRNSHLNATAWLMHTDGYSEAKAHEWLTGRAQADGLEQPEIRKTIQSAFNAPRGTPSYVSQRTRARMRANERRIK